MRKERGLERINNSMLVYSGLVSMLKIQIKIVNTGGSREPSIQVTEVHLSDITKMQTKYFLLTSLCSS